MVHIKDLLKVRRPSDQWFSYVDTKTGEQYHFYTSGIYRKLMHDPILAEGLHAKTLLLKDHYDQIMQYNGIEEHRVKRLKEPHLSLPVLFAVFPDNTHVLIDGNHRYVRKFRDGAKHIDIFMLPEKVWREFLIEGIEDVCPEVLNTMWSGIE